MVNAVGSKFKWHAIMVDPFASSSDVDVYRNSLWDQVGEVFEYFEEGTSIVIPPSDRARAYVRLIFLLLSDDVIVNCLPAQ